MPVEIERDTKAIECPKCGGYAERAECTKEEIEKHGCTEDRLGLEYSMNIECCARAFVCKICGHREAMQAPAPEME